MTRVRRERRPARGPWLAILGMAAIGQRAFLTLWRQPVLVVSTMLFPLVYLLILGNAMNRPGFATKPFSSIQARSAARRFLSQSLKPDLVTVSMATALPRPSTN